MMIIRAMRFVDYLFFYFKLFFKEGPKSGLFMEDESVEENDDDSEVDSSNESDESTEEEEKDEQQSVQSESEEEVIETQPKRKPKAFKFVAVDSRRQLNTLKTGEKEVDEVCYNYFFGYSLFLLQGLDKTFGDRRKIMKKEASALVEMKDAPFGSKSISFMPVARKKIEKK